MATNDAPHQQGSYAPPGEDVKRWQEWLSAAGYYHGDISGSWDETTWQAMTAWQADNHLGTSGEADAQSEAKIHQVGNFLTNAPADPVAEKARQLYGPGMAALLDNPELAPIIQQAVANAQDNGTGGWSIERLQGAIQQTNWWRDTTAASRKWDELNATDPNSANLQRQQKILDVRKMVGQMGVSVSEQTIGQMAEDALRTAMPSSGLSTMIANLASYNPNKTMAQQTGGDLASYMDQLRGYARQNLLHPSESELYDQSRRILGGQLTLDGAKATFLQQAKLNNPYIADLLDAGSTVSDFFAETKRTIADALEMDPAQVDLNDTKWAPILGSVDGHGVQRPMTKTETMAYLNKLPEADGTNRMIGAATGLANSIRQTMLFGTNS